MVGIKQLASVLHDLELGIFFQQPEAAEYLEREKIEFSSQQRTPLHPQGRSSIVVLNKNKLQCVLNNILCHCALENVNK